MIKVSLIVPVYNVEKYLARCLDSCINQSYPNTEIICVNDGSTDNSLDILEHYQKFDNRIKIINKENGGLSSARNAGLAVAESKYLLFVDSDDYISSVAVENLLNNAETYQADLVIFDYMMVKKDGLMRISPENALLENKIYSIETIDGRFYNKLPVSAWCKLYRTDFLKDNQLEFDEGLIYEDVAFFAKVYTKAKRITYLKKPFYSYLASREGQIMNQRGIKLFDVMTVYDIAETALLEAGYYEKCKSSFEIARITDIVWKFEIINNELREKFFNKIRSLDIKIDYSSLNKKDLHPYMEHALQVMKLIQTVNNYNEFLKLERTVQYVK